VVVNVIWGGCFAPPCLLRPGATAPVLPLSYDAELGVVWTAGQLRGLCIADWQIDNFIQLQICLFILFCIPLCIM